MKYRKFRTGRNLTRTFPKIVPKFVLQKVYVVYVVSLIFFFFFWSTELACTMFDRWWWRKIEKSKSDRRAMLRYGILRKAAAKGRARASYKFRLYVFVRYARSRECQDSLSCWTGLALANEREDERWRLKELTWTEVKTTAESFAASAKCERETCQ